MMEKPKRGPRTTLFAALFAMALFAGLVAPILAEEIELKPDHPDRYTVKKGDTLWEISSRFLKSPWHWPRIWKVNDQIKNPHLIYPGDVIVFRYVDGKPELTLLRNEKLPFAEAPAPGKAAEPGAPAPALPEGSTGRVGKLSPSVRGEPIDALIPTIPPNAIMPFLTYPLAVSERELDRAGYVTTGLDNRIALGTQSEFYGRNVNGDDEYYQIFRRGSPIRHPDTNELLAYEAVYLGDAKKLEPGDPAKFVVTAAKQEIQPTDRLLVAPAHAVLPYYFPSAPTKQLRGRIVLALNAVAEIGTYGVVAITLGSREGIIEGNVLRVMRHEGTHRDPVTHSYYDLPDEESGLVMIFRVYEKVSYALVMRSTSPVHLLDAVVTP